MAKRKKPKTLKEGDYQNMIKKYMEQNGFLVFKIPPAIYTNAKGLPDLVCIREGRTIWIEVKTPNGRLTKGQEKTFGMMREHGAEVYVVKGFDEEYLAEIVSTEPQRIQLDQKCSQEK